MNAATVISMLLRIVGGGIVLCYGRRIFGFVIGLMGFLFGLYISILLFQTALSWTALAIGVFCGGISIVLARFLQRTVFAIAGFLGGGILALVLADIIQAHVDQTFLNWPDVLVFFIGGVLGAILIGYFTNWALVILSSFLGADAIVSAIDRPFHLHPTVATLLLLILVFVGIAVQSGGVPGVSKGPVPARLFG